VSEGYLAWTQAGVAVSGRFLYLTRDHIAYVSTKAGAVRFSTPIALRRQLEGIVRGTLITITYKGQESNRKMFDVVTSLCEG
jgi:hypothetical protein